VNGNMPDQPVAAPYTLGNVSRVPQGDVVLRPACEEVRAVEFHMNIAQMQPARSDWRKAFFDLEPVPQG
jgi:hypothetical protein